jgi:chemotaxis signal transduction protein
MTDAGDGWLLHLGGGRCAAIGLRQMLYVLPDKPTTYTVPRAPAYATRVLMWQEHLVPLIDLDAYLYGAEHAGSDASNSQTLVGVVACATGSETSSSATLGAFLMSRAPDRIQVSDSQGCPLPNALTLWAPITASCFRHPQYGPVPILDLPVILTPSK